MKVGFSQISCVDEQRWHGWKCSWVITRYRCYLAVWWEVNLSDLLGAAQRPEFKVGDPGAKLAAGLAEQHQPATTCMLLLSQPPWILFPPSSSSSLTSLICIPAISYSHSSYLHLICPSHSLNSTWRQLCGLSCKCCFHSVTGLIFTSCKSDDLPHLLSRPGNQNDLFLAPLKIKWILARN